MRSCTRAVVFFALAVVCTAHIYAADPMPRWSKTPAWLTFQALPSVTVMAAPQTSRVALEWEVTPLIYSFGMTALVSPWHSFFVVPTERFTGSIELVASGMVFTRQYNESLFGGSIQLLGHIPVLERGERLGLNIGVAHYWAGGSSSVYAVGGFSTLFGIVHVNARYSPSQKIWMGALEFRIF